MPWKRPLTKPRMLAAGDTVALLLPHGGALMACFAGALWLGAVPTILAYPTFKVDPHKYRRGLAGVAANLDASLVVIAQELPEEFFFELLTMPGVTARVLPDLDELDGGAAPSRAQPAPDSIAFIQHSGGTTGLQKSVPITHRQALRHIRRLADGLGVQAQDRMYSWLPLYHDMGLITAFLLPLAVIISLPVGLFGSFLSLKAMGLSNDVYAQIGLVMLVGLLGKNAILIVEFAVQRRQEGASLKEAAIEGGKLRFRPILMTSFAFIAGMIPLVRATGPGAIGNRTIGTTAVGGMLVGTVIGVLLIPGLYYIFGKMADGKQLLKDESHGPLSEVFERPTNTSPNA